MRKWIHLSPLALAVLVFPAFAQEAPAPEAPTAPETPAAVTAPATGAELAEMRAAATAAREAAEAAKAAAEASRAAVEAMKPAAAPAAAPAEAPAAAPPTPSPWGFQFGVSLIAVSGNANSVTGKIAAGATGSWDKWAAKLDASAAYGQTTAATVAQKEVTALNGGLTLRGDRKIGPKFSIYLLSGVSTDHVASIEYQALAEAGAGLLWFENKEADFVKSSLRTDLGFRYTRESRFQYYPAPLNLDDVDIYAPRLGLSFRYAISKRAVFTEEAEILPDLVNTKNVRASSTSTLTAALGDGIGLSVAFKVRHIGDPAEGKKPTDTELAAGVTWTF